MSTTTTYNEYVKLDNSEAGFASQMHANLDLIDATTAKMERAAVRAPGVGDDVDDGYSAGSIWIYADGPNIYVCESAAQGAAVWRQVWPTSVEAGSITNAMLAGSIAFSKLLGTDISITNAMLAGSISQDKLAGGILNSQLATADGWIAGPALTFGSETNAPNYTVTCTGDYSAIITPGMRIKLTHSSTVKYFIVVAVSYTSPSTTLTLYGGTDYTLESGTITLPYYSMVKAPAGFPLDPAKWSVTLTDTTARVQSSPSASTYYYWSALELLIPLGVWNIKASMVAQSWRSAAGVLDITLALSTSSSSISDTTMQRYGYMEPLTNFIAAIDFVCFAAVTDAAGSLYYVIMKTEQTDASGICVNGSVQPTIIVATCAYL